eukprot:1178387-Prorocentrum_minimum.AAC.5
MDNAVTSSSSKKLEVPRRVLWRLDRLRYNMDGSVINPDGSITRPDGTVIKPDGTVIGENGQIIGNIKENYSGKYGKYDAHTAKIR